MAAACLPMTLLIDLDLVRPECAPLDIYVFGRRIHEYGNFITNPFDVIGGCSNKTVLLTGDL